MNTRNNLLNEKNFVFPEFFYDDNIHIKISCSGDLYDIYDKDKELKSTLRSYFPSRRHVAYVLEIEL